MLNLRALHQLFYHSQVRYMVIYRLNSENFENFDFCQIFPNSRGKRIFEICAEVLVPKFTRAEVRLPGFWSRNLDRHVSEPLSKSVFESQSKVQVAK